MASLKKQLIHTQQLLTQQFPFQHTSGSCSVYDGEQILSLPVNFAFEDNDQLITTDVQNNAAVINEQASDDLWLHQKLYQVLHEQNVNAIIHVHSINASVLTRRMANSTQLVLKDYEMLSAFIHNKKRNSVVGMPIVDNVELVIDHVDHQLPGILLRGHGFYVWGQDIQHCYKRVQALEHMLDCEQTFVAAR